MSSYTKADFYAAYGAYAVDPVTRHRFAKFRSPDIEGGAELTLRLHYHPVVQKEAKAQMAQRLVDHFIAQGAPLTADERIVIIGGAFGWTGEALEDLVPGILAVSVDLSQYVQDTKALSPDDELIESIQAEGLDHTTGPGKHLFDKFTDPNPRSRNPDRVLQEALDSPKSRNEVRKALQQMDPTRVITEETWQILTQAEQDKYTAAAASWGVPLTHIIDGVII